MAHRGGPDCFAHEGWRRVGAHEKEIFFSFAAVNTTHFHPMQVEDTVYHFITKYERDY